MDLSIPFLDIEGKPVEKDGKAVLLSHVITSCLASGAGTAEEKLGYFSLALRIQSSSKDINLTLAERTMIKEVVGKTGTVLTVGRVWELFDKNKE